MAFCHVARHEASCCSEGNPLQCSGAKAWQCPRQGRVQQRCSVSHQVGMGTCEAMAALWKRTREAMEALSMRPFSDFGPPHMSRYFGPRSQPVHATCASQRAAQGPAEQIDGQGHPEWLGQCRAQQRAGTTGRVLSSRRAHPLLPAGYWCVKRRRGRVSAFLHAVCRKRVCSM